MIAPVADVWTPCDDRCCADHRDICAAELYWLRSIEPAHMELRCRTFASDEGFRWR